MEEIPQPSQRCFIYNLLKDISSTAELSAFEKVELHHFNQNTN